jgi:choline dehydrogenase-like flavoprotein
VAITEEIADVIVVGAGPSGGVVSSTLADAGLSVVCLEQGDWVSSSDFPTNSPEWELLIQERWAHHPSRRNVPADYPVETSDSDLEPIMWNGVGGGTLFFGAQWPRLFPSDLRVRTLDGVAEDWPLTYDELVSHYDAVDKLVGVSGLGDNPAYPPGQDYPLPPHPLGKVGMTAAAGFNKLGWHWWPATSAIPSVKFRELAQCERWGTCEWGCPKGSKASADIAFWVHGLRSGAELVTGARVRQVTIDGDGRVESVSWVDRAGEEHRQLGRAVVMCANGVGTPRILLNSRSNAFPNGLANSSGMLGKNLMLHPTPAVLGIYEEEQNTHGPAGESISSFEFYETRPEHSFVRGMRFGAVPFPGPLNHIEWHRSLGFDQVWGAQIHRIAKNHNHGVLLFALCDDLPEETNTVTLDPELVDSSGIPAAKVSYKLSDNTRKQIDFAVDRLIEVHKASGAIRTVALPFMPDQPGHLLGTARMGAEPTSSVVDSYGRSHDVDNLYIADGSIFVTGGGVNPTATIHALALRVAEGIVKTFEGQQKA